MLCVLMAKCVYLYVLKKSAKLLYIFGERHKPNNLFTRHITGLHLKDAKRKVKALLNKIFCSWFLTIPFIFQFYFSSIVFAFSWMLDVIQWNYKYVVLISVYYTCTCMGFFSTRSQNISHLYVLDRLNWQNILMNFNKKMMSCKIHETSVCFVLFGLILLEVVTP